MKYLILTCNAGEGHNSAAASIREYIEKNGDFCATLEVFSLISKQLSNVIGKSHARIYRYTPVIFDKGYELSEKHEKLLGRDSVFFHLLSYGSKALFHTCREVGFDRIICVHPFCAMLVQKMENKYGLHIHTSLIGTDYTCCPCTNASDADVYFAASPRLLDDYITEGIPEEQIIFSGIPVRQCFVSEKHSLEARNALGLDVSKKIILMCCGSMGCGPIEKLAQLLVKEMKEDSMLVVVCGSNRKLHIRLSDIVSDKIRVIGYTRQMDLYMSACDVFVTKPGGISTTEAANLGVPMVFVNAVAGCEKYNRHFFKAIDGAVADTSSVEMIAAEALSLLENTEKQECMRQNLAKEFCRNSAKIIYDYLNSL